MSAVKAPMINIDTQKHNQPPRIPENQTNAFSNKGKRFVYLSVEQMQREISKRMKQNVTYNLYMLEVRHHHHCHHLIE